MHQKLWKIFSFEFSQKIAHRYLINIVYVIYKDEITCFIIYFLGY